MRVLLAHALTPKRRRIARVLSGGGSRGRRVRGFRTPRWSIAAPGRRTWRHPRPSAAATSCATSRRPGRLLDGDRHDRAAGAVAAGRDRRHAPRRPGLPRRAGRRRRGADPRRGRSAHQGAPAGTGRAGRAARGAAARGRAHRPVQPARDPDPARRHGLRRPPSRAPALDRGAGPRPLQVDQRHPRPQDRRRGADRRRARDGHAHARRGPARAPGRRGVPRAAARHRRRGRHAHGRARARRGGGRAERRCRSRSASAWPRGTGETAEEFLQRADEALYAAKEAGRDRVMAATLHGRT